MMGRAFQTSRIPILLVGLAMALSTAVAAKGYPPSDWPSPVSAESLVVAGGAGPAPGAHPIEIGVVVFDPVPSPQITDAAGATLRETEARLTATTLRNILSETNLWGAVRVLPGPSRFAGLTVEGAIVHSDGRDLVVDLRVTDAAGRVWLDRRFRGGARLDDYASATVEPFRPLYVAVANALHDYASRRSGATWVELNRVAALRYAAELAPAAFSDYLRVTDGKVAIERLPAEEDPMLARIGRIRRQESLFVDTVDQQFTDLLVDLGPTYNLWRRSTLEQVVYLEAYTARAAEREHRDERGSFAAMHQMYSTYRSVRIQAQDLFDLARAFDSETAATTLTAGERVVELSGTLEEQYKEWRGILARIIELEQGTCCD